MKKLLIFCALILISSALFALPEDFRLSVEQTYTLQNGTLVEYVFSNDYKNQEYKESELDWPVKNLSYFGAKVQGGWKHLEVYTDFATAIPGKSGSMDDFDWLNEYNHDMCTNRSTTDNEVQKSYNFNFKTGARFNPISTLQIVPLVGFSYSTINFYSANGSLWYGDKDHHYLKEKDTGKIIGCYRKNPDFSKDLPYDDDNVAEIPCGEDLAISYDREMYSFSAGINVTYTLFEDLTFGIYAYTMPFTYVRTIDHHFYSDSYYLDIMENWFQQWNFGTSVEYRIWKGLSVTTTFDYNLLTLGKGINYTTTQKPKFFKSDKTSAGSGCEGQWWNLQAGVKWSF